MDKSQVLDGWGLHFQAPNHVRLRRIYALTMYTEDPAFRERPCIRRMNDAIRANSREHVLRTDQHFRDLLAAILVDDVTSKKQ